MGTEREDVTGHGLKYNVNETTAEDDDVESHGSLPNTNETVVEDEPEGRGARSTDQRQRNGRRR